MQYCDRPGCNRAGDDVGNCGWHATKCPRFKEVDPAKHIVTRCTACDKTRCFSVSDIMQGKSKYREDCGRSQCLAVVVPVKGSKAKAKTSDEPPEQ